MRLEFADKVVRAAVTGSEDVWLPLRNARISSNYHSQKTVSRHRNPMGVVSIQCGFPLEASK